ncbi:MAG: DHH family phosphoesterase [Candidatus Nealsonbacteria bacterium]|nr:DHH family phosphoesterase [Candidatus Nealsonbacteria bacterium]
MSQDIKNLDKAAKRIIEGIKNKERFILFGDADPDGVSSVVILKETLEAFGAKRIIAYFPDREQDGYGLNQKALSYLKNKAPGILITLDCGIGNFKEVERAKKTGFYVIIVDHHRLTTVVAKPNILVDPFQEGDNSTFKDFAAGGLSFLLSKLILNKAHPLLKGEQDRFLELAALATVADQMKLEDENERIVREGIIALSYTKRKGLILLIKRVGFGGGKSDVIEKLLPPLSAAGPKGNLNEAYLLLIENNLNKAKKMVNVLVKKALAKKDRQQRIYAEVLNNIEDKNDSIIFEGKNSWPLVLLGAVASKLCQKHNKPVFLYRRGRKESPGSVRAPKGVDSVKAMTSCEKLLVTYGGHPPASGFRVKNENLDKFKSCLIKYFEER